MPMEKSSSNIDLLVMGLLKLPLDDMVPSIVLELNLNRPTVFISHDVVRDVVTTFQQLCPCHDKGENGEGTVRVRSYHHCQRS